ncbi:hypothetical protein B4U79_00260 [Dinothrombium tinctorium]|uniref:Uncharacterized protein n=1 Tax=Dinothrombium tinctorium TaxID=1965070 RepID=A0A443QNU7_9ACAR|nr:hypothetical protein B4U79_13779 [Dinothrombium tinctorium]RWS04708.1 hypothetical protein B4U79_00260 [Dinothrombium tinctorium]
MIVAAIHCVDAICWEESADAEEKDCCSLWEKDNKELCNHSLLPHITLAIFLFRYFQNKQNKKNCCRCIMSTKIKVSSVVIVY